eukprot:snap_masked-scaffold_3-processed-gene-15.63-mRNA-1 protein AED:0.07 eAED:0.07 QI:0/-1/0/1/-1/1/1/0/305
MKNLAKVALANLTSEKSSKYSYKLLEKATPGLISNNRFFPGSVPLHDILCLNSSDFELFQEDTLKDNFTVPYDEIKNKLLAPVCTSHFTIYCIGKNYSDHIKEMKALGTAVPQKGEPIVFSKALSSINSPFGEISFPENTSQIDYEGELAIIIGKPGKSISPETALEHIFGFTIINDISARDVQKKHIQWLLGKSVDGFSPIGPFITPKENFLTDNGDVDYSGFKIVTKVNEEVRQDGSADDMIFGISELISKISESITLQTGDVIATGTPSGVGAGFDPPKYLEKGDRVSVEISGLGKISNKFT